MILLETNRLIIRNFHPDDWQDLQEMTIEHQATEWAKLEPLSPTGEEDVKGMAAFFASGDSFLAVVLKATGKQFGVIAIERREGQEEPVHNLGYTFHPGYSRQGYATESCLAVMAYLFEQEGIAAILTGTRPENIPSVRLLARLGIPPIGNGEYRITKEEWLARQRAAQ